MSTQAQRLRTLKAQETRRSTRVLRTSGRWTASWPARTWSPGWNRPADTWPEGEYGVVLALIDAAGTGAALRARRSARPRETL